MGLGVFVGLVSLLDMEKAVRRAFLNLNETCKAVIARLELV